jgi:hypothetical protein
MHMIIDSVARMAGVLAALALSYAQAQPQPVPEDALKAAFVYNFALFTDWPADVIAGAELTICINPNSGMRAALGSLHGKTLKGRRIAVRQQPAPEALRGCHLLFVDGIDRERWTQIKKGIGNASVLTVSDDGEIGRDGIIITLALSDNRMVFDIDMDMARQARLLLSSKLLRLARVVQ